MARQNNSNQIIGIDIGSSLLKLVCVSGNKIIKAASEFLPEELSLDENRHTSDAMANLIKQTAQNAGIPLGNAAVVLPGNQVYARTVTMPAMTENQLTYNLPYEFRDYLIEDNNKYNFDYSMLKMIYDVENNPKDMQLFICATLKKTIDEYASTLRKAGMKLISAVPGEYALSVGLKNIVSYTDPALAMQSDAQEQPFPEQTDFNAVADSNARCYCVADLGYKFTELFFYCNSDYRLKKTVDFGMYDLEKIVSEVYDTDVYTARSYILANRDGILESERCLDTYSALAVEVMKVINYFNYNNREAGLDSLFICGGGAIIDHFSDAIQSASGIRVRPAQELVADGTTLDNPSVFVQAYNCAVREQEGGK